MNRIIDNARECHSILEGIGSHPSEEETDKIALCRVDAALALLKEIDSEVIEATLSLVMRKELTREQFYLLRAPCVLKSPSNVEYEDYLTKLRSRFFPVDCNTQVKAAAAWFGTPRQQETRDCKQEESPSH